jgi:hypothetical protein
VRARRKVSILYCYGDVSRSGFGWCIDFGDGVRYDLGEWCDHIQEATSNYREFRNLVNAMVRAPQEGRLEGCKVFLYTDNQTAEGAYCKGTAKSRALFSYVVLYKLQMEFDFILHVIWIAGTRMIHQGTYGLSRGGRTGYLWVVFGRNGAFTSACAGEDPWSGGMDPGMVEHWDKSGSIRSQILVHHRSQPRGFWWIPAPVAADAAIDQFCEALHKRPHCYHVFAIPFLMTNRWRKTLLKAVNVYFVLKPVCEIWDNSQHEPLGVFIFLRLRRHEPWRLRHTQPVVDLARSLREVPDTDFIQKGHLLCEFL